MIYFVSGVLSSQVKVNIYGLKICSDGIMGHLNPISNLIFFKKMLYILNNYFDYEIIKGKK